MIAAVLAAAAALPQAAAGAAHFSVPEGFVVDRPSELAGSLLALCFGPDGSAYVGRESAGIVRLLDVDRDGRYEKSEDVAPELVDCQGLAVYHGALYATGSREGKPGVWRVPLTKDGARAGDSERVFEFTGGGEHGAHALVVGPRGDLYLMVGNQAAFADADAHLQGYWKGDEGRLLAPYMDPLGFGTRVRYPAGFVARIDPEKRTWEFVAVGLRNAYDFAFDDKGYMFAVDSDMEWDLGLPWYRPVRLLEIIEGADYGSRAGSGVIPEWCVDTEPALLDLGRGSPTGAVFGTKTKFAYPWQWALFSGDWARGRIVAIWPGTNYFADVASCADFLTADTALPITDVEVGPEGGLWFLTGGRGAHGGVFRVLCPGERESSVDKESREGIIERIDVEIEAKRAIDGKLDPAQTIPVFNLGFGRSMTPLQLRTGALLARSRSVEELSSTELRARLFALASLERGENRADLVARAALELLHDDDAVQEPHDRRLATLRGLELGLLRQGDPSPELANELATRLLALFPHEDARVSGEVAVLLAHLDDARALAPLLAQMQKSPQELAIHYCDCVHRMTRGWDVAKRAALLEWFAKSREYTGGISLPGYLSAMRAHFVEHTPPEECAELAARDGIDPESLALLLARLPHEDAGKLFPRFETALSHIAVAKFGSPEQVQKDSALRALERLQLPEVEALARKLAQTQGDLLEAPWTLLARAPAAQDYDLWLSAIVSPSPAKREAALRALGGIERSPAAAEEWRALLDEARELGNRRGRELARTLARWSNAGGGAAPSSALELPAEFEAALAALERWYVEEFPSGPPPVAPEAAPRWSEAQMLAFLERAAARPGSAAHGRAVFEAASCITCHAIGRAPASDSRGFGPDLANVTDRLTRADLLAAIVAPSRAVSDQYRAFVARTNDERQFEGLVTRRDARGIVLQPLGGAPVEIDADELESLEPSPRSPMPEGLLEARTLEDVRDLFAYLKAPDAPAAANAWSPLFGPHGVAGWSGDAAVWSVRGTTLVGRSSGLSRSAYLLAKQPARDLLVEFDVFLPPGGNSGLCYRAELPAGSADPSGLQADLGQSYWGSLYAADGRTLAAPDPEVLASALDREGWNHVLVRFEGDEHALELNGLETYRTRESSAAGTLFGFQVHQGKPMQVRIANARWRAP